jgi:hypothetical protein
MRRQGKEEMKEKEREVGRTWGWRSLLLGRAEVGGEGQLAEERRLPKFDAREVRRRLRGRGGGGR